MAAAPQSDRIWYVSQKGKASGPMTRAELMALVSQGNIKGHDLMFCEGAAEWKRGFDWPELKESFRDSDSYEAKSAIEVKSPLAPDKSEWVLLVREGSDSDIRFRQKGPFTTDVVRQMVLDGKAMPTDHIWRKGAAKWLPIQDMPEFSAREIKLSSESNEVLSKVIQRPAEAEVPAEDDATLMFSEITDPGINIIRSSAIQIDLKGSEEPRKTFKVEEPARLVIPDLQPPRQQIFSLENERRKEPRVVPPVVMEPSKGKEVFEESQPSININTILPPEAPGRGTKAKEQSVELPPPIQIDVKKTFLEDEEISDVVENLDRPKKKSRWEQLVPVFVVLLLATVGVGIWATFKTKTPLGKLDFSRRSSVDQDGSQRSSEKKPVERVIVPKVAAKLEPAEVAEQPKTPEASPPVAALPASPPPAPPPVAKPAESKLQEIEANIGPGLKFNSQARSIDIGGSFKKGEILKVKVEGKAGQILEIAALNLRLEVKAQRDEQHRISWSDLRLPKGEFQASVQWGSQKIQKTLSIGKDSDQYQDQLTSHRKAIVYDQQQEKKRLIRVAKEFVAMANRAEQVGSATGAKSLAREMDSKTPAEIKQVRQARNQLIFKDNWERLSQYWEKTSESLKEWQNRNPASVAELAKAKKEASTIESDMRNQSLWDY